jgi:hypothetical protein
MKPLQQRAFPVLVPQFPAVLPAKQHFPVPVLLVLNFPLEFFLF